MPGATALARMPKPPSSMAKVCTHAMSPALAAPYAACIGAAVNPLTEAINTIVPPPDFDMSRPKACDNKNAWRRQMSISQSKVSSVMSRMDSQRAIPTMSTRPSMRPLIASASAASFAAPSRVVTSPTQATPAGPISAAISAARSASTSTHTTVFAPACTSACEVMRPMPTPAPATTNVRPSTRRRERKSGTGVLSPVVMKCSVLELIVWKECHAITTPPLGRITCPVMNRDASLAR